MIDSLPIVKDLAIIAAPLTATIVETWVKPKIANFFKGQRATKALLEANLEARFTEYLDRSFKRHSFMNTVVFQNHPQLLEELYLPLTIESVGKPSRLKIDSWHQDFVPRYKKALLLDTAGMGKSTLLRFLFLQAIKENAGIPVFIELRQLAAGRNILDVLFDELNPIDDTFDRDVILKFVRRGDFIFFLDGYDEVPFADRGPVTRDLQSFVSKAENNTFVISSRPEPALATFTDFQQFTIHPLELKEALALIRRYGKHGQIAEQLIEKLRDETLRSILEFLTNPLLVSLLYKCYEYKPTIPLRKHIFYRQVYDALFESHDLTKGDAFNRAKHSALDIDDFHRVLRILGYVTFTHGKMEYTKDELLSCLERAGRQCPGITLRHMDFLKDLTSTVPVFVVDGNYIRWSHKSIQEYFAAQFICSDSKSSQPDIMRKMLESLERERYINVLDLCYDVDYKTFRKTLLYPMAQRFIAYSATAPLLTPRGGVTSSDINAFRASTFSRRYVIFPSSFVDELTNRDVYATTRQDLVSSGIVSNDEIISTATIWRGSDGRAMGGVFELSAPDATLIRILDLKEDALVQNVQVRQLKGLVSPQGLTRGKKLFVVSSALDNSQVQGQKLLKINILIQHSIGFRDGVKTLNLDSCNRLVREVDSEESTDAELLSMAELL